MKKFGIHLNHFKDQFSFCIFRRRIYLFSFFLIFILSFAAIFFYESIFHKEGSSIVRSLNAKEQNDLKLFFYDLFVDNELGYTLFGSKPMSFCTPNACPPRFSKKDFIFRLYLEGTRPLFKGLTVWEKINSKIKNKNYSFIICKEGRSPKFVILIDNDAFEKEFLKNIDLFRKYLGQEVTVKSLLNGIIGKKSYDEIANGNLFRNDILLGIMLGFGRHNAALFQRRENLITPKAFLTFPTPSVGFSSVQEEIHYLWQHLKPSSTIPDCLLRVTRVGFVGDPEDPETHALVKRYEVTHEQLISIFDRDDWLEIVLAQFSKN